MSIAAFLERPFVTLSELLRYHAEAQPQHLALVLDQAELTYADLNRLADRFAAALQRDGVGPGDAIAICALSSFEYVAAFLGALRAGVAVAPLAPSSTPESLTTMATDAGAALFFADAPVAKQLEAVRSHLPVRLIMLDDADGGERFSDWLAPAGATPQAVEIDPVAPFNIIYSSGTTGAPKGIVQSHRMRWAHIARGAGYEYGPQATTLISTPLYSNTTLVSFFPTIGLGGTVVLMPKFEATKYLELAQKHRVTHTMLVPVQYQRLVSHPEFDRYDLSSFKKKFCTSAPFSAELKAEVLERWPGGLIEFYGMTEGGGTCILAAHEYPDKLHTVGLPAPGHDIRLIDDSGREVARGELGEVVGHSPATMMNCYHKQPAKTAEVEWYDESGKRFIRTGDVGRFDEDGFLVLVDRKKDMIISGGFNIYPSDLESVVREHPAVEDVSVVGMPSQKWGETPVAFVVLKPGVKVTAEALLQWANTHLGKTQRIAAVQIVDSLPRSAIGKVLKRELREAFRPDQGLAL